MPSIWPRSSPPGARPSGAPATERLLARGRAKKEASTILARALLRVIYHLLRTGEASDPTLHNQPSPATAG